MPVAKKNYRCEGMRATRKPDFLQSQENHSKFNDQSQVNRMSKPDKRVPESDISGDIDFGKAYFVSGLNHDK